MQRLNETSAVYHIKYPPSTDIFVCKHGVGYPDLCSECNKEAITAAARVVMSDRITCDK